MKKTFNFALGEDEDLDGALDAKLAGNNKIQIRTEGSASKSQAKTPLLETGPTAEEPVVAPKPASEAAQKLRDLNAMELKVGPKVTGEADDCEIYGGEYPDVDIDLQN